MRDLTVAAEDLKLNKKLVAVILKGNADNFSFGFDLRDKELNKLKTADQSTKRDYFLIGKKMCEAWENLPFLTVCLINGWCVGGGVALAVSCDLRVASNSSKFYVPELKRGLNMSWGSIPRINSLIGPAKTKRLVLLAEKINSHTAQSWGLIDHYFHAKDLMKQILIICQTVNEIPKLPFVLTKELINNHSQMLNKISSFGDQDAFSLAYNEIKDNIY
jgi:enoyl-CoA hydratase/carnithine racemase